MNTIMNSINSPKQEQRRFIEKFTLKSYFFAAKTLLFTILILNYGATKVNAAPKALRSDIQIRNIINTLSVSP